MIIEALILAALAGWVFDDWCPTPPRPPWPWPGPWPWIRKGLAVLGGIGAHVALQGGVVNETLNLTSIIIVGGIGGAGLASVVSMLIGPKMEQRM